MLNTFSARRSTMCCISYRSLPRGLRYRLSEPVQLSTLPEPLTFASGVYVTKMDDDDFYGPSYISDLLLAALESRADITGKKATFFHFEEGDEYCLRSPDLRRTWLWPVSDNVGSCAVPATIWRAPS